MTVDCIERRALRTINAARVRFGCAPLEALPPGIRRDPSGCALHQALIDLLPGEGFQVDGDRITCDSEVSARRLRSCWSRTRIPADLGPREVALPRSMREFIPVFDHLALPHLSLGVLEDDEFMSDDEAVSDKIVLVDA